MDTYDLLIVFTDGEVKTISDVSDYEYNTKTGFLRFLKNGYWTFVSKEHVKSFGRKCDWSDNKIDSLQAFVYHIGTLPTCNECGVQKNCRYVPPLGRTVRYNCPLFVGRGENE